MNAGEDVHPALCGRCMSVVPVDNPKTGGGAFKILWKREGHSTVLERTGSQREVLP